MAAFHQGSTPDAFRRAARHVFLAAAALTVLQGCSTLSLGGTGDRPDTPYGDYLAGRQAAISFEPKKAQSYFTEALALDPSNSLILDNAFTVTVNAGDMDKAVELARRLVAASPEHRLARLVLALSDLKQQKYESAIAQIGNAQDGAFVVVVGSLIQAWAAAGMNNLELAKQKLSSPNASPVFDVFRAYHQALLLDMLGDVEGAAASFQSAVENTSISSIRVVLAYSSFLNRNGKKQEATEILRQFDILSPDHPLLKKALADIEAGKIAPPLVTNAMQGAAEVFYGLGSVLTQENGNNLAGIYLQFALYLRPDFDVAQTLLGNAYEDQKRWKEAVEVYDRIDRKSPLSENARIRKALVFSKQKKFGEAVNEFKRITSDNPASLQPYVAFGDLYRSEEKYAEALEQYNKAIALIPEPVENRWTVYYARGICHERLQKWDLAEKDLKLALELSDEDPLVLNYLGYSWIEQGKNLTEALTMVEKAVDQRPSDGYIVDSLGWAHYQLGDFAKAVEYLQQAVVLQPADPTINEHLGDAFWKVGRQREARFQWSHALEMEPAEERVQALKAKLKSGLEAAESEVSPKEGPEGPSRAPLPAAPAS